MFILSLKINCGMFSFCVYQMQIMSYSIVFSQLYNVLVGYFFFFLSETAILFLMDQL